MGRWIIYIKQWWNGCWVDLVGDVGVSWICLGNSVVVVSKPLHAPYSSIDLTCATYFPKKSGRSGLSTEAFRGWIAPRHHQPWDVPDFLRLWTHRPSRGDLVDLCPPTHWGYFPKNRTLGWLKCVKKLFPYFAWDIIDDCWRLLILIVGGFMWFEICYRRLMVSNFGLWPPKMVDYSWAFKNVWVLSCLGSWFNEIFSGASCR